MNINQENKSRMYLAVEDFLMAKDAVVGGLPNYTGLFADYRTILGKIFSEDEQLQMRRSVKSGSKVVYKNKLAQLSADISRRLVAWANFNNELELVKQLWFVESKLQRMPDVVLKDVAQGLHNKAKGMISALADYGVTDVNLAELQTAITVFTSIIPKPRLGITSRKELNLHLMGLFKQADKVLDDIDLLIELIRLPNAAFYREYKSARTIVVSGKRKLAVRGNITKEGTKEPIEGAKIEFSGVDAFVLIKNSAEKGGFYVKELSEGTYKVTVTKVGYVSVVETLYVTPEVGAVLKVVLKTV